METITHLNTRESSNVSVEELLAQHTRADAENFKKLDEKLDSIEAALTALKIQAAKDRGFIAGVSFVVGGIVALVSTFGGGILSWLRG